jgi:hypothetical protein
MGAVEESRASIESCLSTLEGIYSSFSVNQTTFSVSTDRYDHIKQENKQGQVDAYAKIQNETGDVLHVTDDETCRLPGTATAIDESIERDLRGSVADTGIESTIDEIEQVTIVGLRDANDEERETIYRLAVVFVGTYKSGTDDDADWQETAVPAARAYV